MKIDHTHDVNLKSWVITANGHSDFPIQNLPFGIISYRGGQKRATVAIGESVLDLSTLLAGDFLSGQARLAVEAMGNSSLNGFLALGDGPRQALRARLSEILRDDSTEQHKLEPELLNLADCEVHLPAKIGDYTDFYVGIHHATNVGKLFRPDSPLMPNYKHIPIGYHGRASSILPSGVPIRRPNGQTKAADAAVPSFGPCQRLDYELELGVWIGPGNSLGESISISHASNHIAGYCLLNDWSARDIQIWEYQPLGPFLAKNFASTISCWIVTPEALAPFRISQPARSEEDPAPLSYLVDAADQSEGALGIELEVFMVTPGLRKNGLEPHRLSRTNSCFMYWTPAQMVAHHTSGGCNLRPGDLLGTGTISGANIDSAGALIETTQGGRNPVHLESGEERGFLEDGDEIILQAHCRRDGAVSIGFGECKAAIISAFQAAN